MPIYEYRCTECDQVFEYMQRMSDAPKGECEACSGKLERLISASAFHLKGGGWYRDLYASPKKEAPAKAEGGSGGDSGSAGKSESGSGSSGSGSSESKGGESGAGSAKSSGGES